MLRAACVVVLITAFSTACGTEREASDASSGTDLTMVAANPNVGRAEFHLQCSPPGGDLPDPAGACTALSAKPALLAHPEPFTCAGGLSSWWDVTVTGALGGEPIGTTFSTCWTPQMETLEELGVGTDDVLNAHLVPRREATVTAGESKVFAVDALRPTDLVMCDILGHHLQVGVPVEATGEPSSQGYGGANVEPVVLEVALNQDESVTASCHRGE